MIEINTEKSFLELRDEILSLNQFKVNVDLGALRVRLADIQIRMTEIEKYFPVDFNLNSSKQKVALLNTLNLGKTFVSSSREAIEEFIGNPTIDLFLEFSSLEKERQFIIGAKGKASGFVDEIDRNLFFTDFGFFRDNISFEGSSSRCSFKRFDRMPKLVRKYILPLNSFSKFYFLDFSKAELAMLAYLSGDTALLSDVMERDLWQIWADFLRGTEADGGVDLPEDDLKKYIKCSIFKMCHTLSDESVHEKLPKRFFYHFFTRYSVLQDFLIEQKNDGIKFKSLNTLYDQKIDIDESTEASLLHSCLVTPIQSALAGYIMDFVTRISNKCYIANFSSTSILVSDISFMDLALLVDETMKEIGLKFNYKITEGSNYYTAQYGD